MFWLLPNNTMATDSVPRATRKHLFFKKDSKKRLNSTNKYKNKERKKQTEERKNQRENILSSTIQMHLFLTITFTVESICLTFIFSPEQEKKKKQIWHSREIHKEGQDNTELHKLKTGQPLFHWLFLEVFFLREAQNGSRSRTSRENAFNKFNKR